MKELREILGEELWGQVEPKLKGQGLNGKDLVLVATNTGEYVPADKYEKVKGDYLKYMTDYNTLNSKYEADIANARKESSDLLKKTLVSQALENANVAKVNGSYDVYFASKALDLDALELKDGKIEILGTTISNFTSSNPQLVVKNAQAENTSNKEANKPVTNVAVPATTGVNPVATSQVVKDANYYKDLISKTDDLTQRVALRMEAEENKIDLNF